MAWTLGFPSAEQFRDSLSTSEWLGWKEWVKIRGPVGPDRWDFYVKRLIFANGAPAWGEEVPTIDDLRMPWDPEPVAATTAADGDGKSQHDAIFVPASRRVRVPTGGGFGSPG